MGLVRYKKYIRVLLLLDILIGRRIWCCTELEARSSRKNTDTPMHENRIGQC